MRVDLPKPNCAVRPSDCADIDVLNTLDGFNIQPRLSIPFTGAIDVASVSSANVFLVRLSDGAVTGINQIVWEPPVNTLHAESDQLLDQHTRYLLVVTNGVKDSAGDPIEASSLLQDLNFGHAKDAADKAYRKELIAALNHSLPAGVGERGRRRREPLHDAERDHAARAGAGADQGVEPSPGRLPDRHAGRADGVPRSRACSVIQFTRQTHTTPAFASSFAPDARSRCDPGSVGTIAFGAFNSPDYETASKVIPAVGSRTGVPAVQGTNRLYFNLFLPAGPAPGGRLAGRDLRARFHRQQELEPVRRRQRRWRVAASRRSRSTSSATASARSEP